MRNTRGGSLAPGGAGSAGLASEAVAALHASARAMLQLHYARNLSDAQIAEVAQLSEGEVTDRRARTVDGLAAELEIGHDQLEDELRGLSAIGWTGAAEPREPESDTDEREEQPEPEPEQPEPERTPAPVEQVSIPAAAASQAALPEDRKRLVRPSLLIALALVAMLALVVVTAPSGEREPASSEIASTRGSVEEGEGSPGPAGPEVGPPGEAEGGISGATRAAEQQGPPDAELTPLPGMKIGGTVTADVSAVQGGRQRVELAFDGLRKPRGRYQAWIYSSVIDSVPLRNLTSGTGRIAALLPRTWREYRFLDVSEQAIEQKVHSGRSVFRVSTDDLAG